MLEVFLHCFDYGTYFFYFVDNFVEYRFAKKNIIIFDLRVLTSTQHNVLFFRSKEIG